MAFFGDLFRPEGSMAAADPPYLAADIRLGLERDLLTTLYGAAVDQDPALAAPDGAMAKGMAARPGSGAYARDKTGEAARPLRAELTELRAALRCGRAGRTSQRLSRKSPACCRAWPGTSQADDDRAVC